MTQDTRYNGVDKKWHSASRELKGGVIWLANIERGKQVATHGISALTVTFGLQVIMMFVTLGQILTFVTIARPKKKKTIANNI